jgi:subtilisin family serine protease
LLVLRSEIHRLTQPFFLFLHLFRTRLASSNWGECVDIYALGEQVLSAWIGDSDVETRKLSGTSTSSPFVTGAIALYLERNPTLSPAKILASLQEDAIPGIFQENELMGTTSFANTSSLLLNIDALIGAVPKASSQTPPPH